MKPPVALFALLLTIRHCELQRVGDENLTTIQIIRKYGYPAEAHAVETEDGYVLEMHRIPNGDKDVGGRKKLPVFIQHGLFGSSTDFVLLGPKKALAFLLADLGFDVWLGNIRGNTYSRAHVYLSPNDSQFWDFSWHESGIYDLPAMIDYITDETKTEKVIYLGHSMGTTTFFVMTSTLPEYNDKIETSLLMAPVAYLKNMKSPLIRGLLPLASVYKVLADLLTHGEFLPHDVLIQTFGELFCILNKVETRLCENIIFLVTGSDPEQFDEKLMPILLEHYPAGYSVRGVYHYSQLVQSGAFRQYDFGRKENLKRYDSQTPPDYNVSSITAEMNFYIGLNDYLATPPDIKRLAKELPTLQKLRVVNNTQFTHLDFLIARDAKNLLYDVMIKDIQAHLNKYD